MADLYMSDSQHSESAFGFAADTTKQLLLLATGIITITVALLGDLKKTHGTFSFLHVAWILDATSILLGVITLMALTGQVSQGNQSSGGIYAGNVRIGFLLQLAAFVSALGFTIAFGISAT